MPNTVEVIGTVEILRPRLYPIDAESPEPRVEVIVEPGEPFPLYVENGYSHFWLMKGKLQAGGVRRVGDGMILASKTDIPLDVTVTFPSRRLGPDEWRELLAEPVCTEGHDDQRLRVTLDG